nr:MAG TPA: hypothetical protein [Caudoviricetes sp.]
MPGTTVKPVVGMVPEVLSTAYCRVTPAVDKSIASKLPPVNPIIFTDYAAISGGDAVNSDIRVFHLIAENSDKSKILHFCIDQLHDRLTFPLGAADLIGIDINAIQQGRVVLSVRSVQRAFISGVILFNKHQAREICRRIHKLTVAGAAGIALGETRSHLVKNRAFCVYHLNTSLAIRLISCSIVRSA